MAESMDAAQAAIIEEMSGLEGGIARYQYLVELGRSLEEAGEGLRTAAHVVPGCQSQVWIRSELREGRLHLQADSDALITRGIVALLLRVLSGRTPEEILGSRLHFLDETGLRGHLSPSRANGLAAMVKEIRRQAAEIPRAD